MKTVNLNEYVRLTITDKGRSMLLTERSLPGSRGILGIVPDSEGKFILQLCEAFQLFGSSMHVGFDQPFLPDMEVLGYRCSVCTRFESDHSAADHLFKDNPDVEW